MNDFIPFALPDISQAEISEVIDTLKSGWLSSGPKTKLLEKNFSDFISPGINALAVNSATSGLHLALDALGIGPGDEVITTTHTFTATAEVIRYTGADVRFVDIDSKTLNIHPVGIRAAITDKTKAIIPVHFAGLSCDMDEILSIAKEYNLYVIEDAAHALPSYYKGRIVGSLESDATVFSFYANKTMTTGEGGMVVTKNSELAERMRIMRLHGINRDAFDRFRSEKASWYYEVVAPGYKYNLSDISSAIGIQQLKRLPDFLKRRQYLAARYLDKLSSLPLRLPLVPDDSHVHAWHLFVISSLDDSDVGRDDLINWFQKNKIGTSVHYVPLHRQPYWRDRYDLKPSMFPVSENTYLNSLSIPLYTSMTDKEQDRIISILREVF